MPMLRGRITALNGQAPDEANVDPSARWVLSGDRGVTYGAAPPAIVARARAIADVCAEFGVTTPAAAVQFPFGHKAVKSVVVGMSRLKAVAENAAW
ncbi:hypothetical protein J8J40_21570, partial [Mycobacterium tuberculosis]|nr:hypothetical protein [Mycobacterium tuberculosis]